MGIDYRTVDNGRMKRSIFALLICLLSPVALAWNAAGHRLIALIAWQQMQMSTQQEITSALRAHPDYQRWLEKAGPDKPAAIFAEAANWPDTLRNDPRFYDETRDTPTPPIPGLPDQARHKRWHYVDVDAQGKTAQGELDRQIDALAHLLRSTRDTEQISWALPWLAHLVGDIHQPLHVGFAADEGGNLFEIENPLRGRQPFSNLHSYWDDLPGPSSLRGPRLEKLAALLVDRHPPPIQGNTTLWRDESHARLKEAYPETPGSLLPIITEAFDQKARLIAEQRITAAGYRLGRWLDKIFSRSVSRETP